MEPSTIYLRIKRDKRILFFECYLTDYIEQIKRKLQNFYKQEPNEMRLFYGSRLLDDKANLIDQNIQNDAEIQLKLKKPCKQSCILNNQLAQEWEE